MSSLPVAAVLPELLSALQHAPQVLLNAPTGAGKSTWLPLQILAESNIAGRIILLEPRRLAARNVAQRLAELLGEKPGETVGFRMRAETCVGPQTRLEVVTEGILTRMIQRDPELTGVGLVILDEFHERSLQADLALALLLDVQQGLRDDLKLLIMSATLDNDRLQRLLPEAPVVVSEGRYQLANGMGAMLDADDALGRHEWLIAPLLLQGSASPDARMLLALPVEIGELIAARPELAKSSDTVEWDEAQGTLKAWRRTVIGQLVIKTQPLAKPSEAELHQAMLNGIREKGLGMLNWTPEAEQLRLRLHCAAQWLPEEAWPAVDDASLLASLETWLLPQMNGVHSLRALKALDLRQALQDWLPWPLRQKLDRELPTHYTVPTGSRLAIRYHAENPPALAVRMQEMFGEATTPVIAEGRVPLVLELLSPAQRPLQITRDLSAFWQGSYREVQKEMKGRYPKHVWPDDPANAAPTRRSKKYS
ncbi:ATP-dependent helicase C-terminal domain-containing protein [Klebsiella pneumoniae]|uniref:ATP-dependent helicase C-terminal domain-containing protein n=1 Tax=Klebsiella pneumoniae TaxID=573 RepID=UPI003D1C180A